MALCHVYTSYVDSNAVQVPLDRLNERLKLHVEQLRADLVDVINADYPEFMALSDQLGSVDGAVARLKAPLLKLQGSLAEVQERYTQELHTLEECLQRQSQVRNGPHYGARSVSRYGEGTVCAKPQVVCALHCVWAGDNFCSCECRSSTQSRCSSWCKTRAR